MKASKLVGTDASAWVKQVARAPANLLELYAANDNLFVGMIIEIASKNDPENKAERMLLETKPFIVTEPPDWPDAVEMQDADFTIKSVFKSSDGSGRTQLDLECEDVTAKIGKCGGYTVINDAYAPDDPFTKVQEDEKDQGAEVVLECLEGYRAVSETCAHSIVVDEGLEDRPECSTRCFH